jgi:hypothetical protein
MRAAALCALALAAGCTGATTTGGDTTTMPPDTTGLVLELHFDHSNVMQVELSGATYATSRRFGPYVVAEKALPRDSTVGFVFDAGDAGMAMVCAETHDLTGKVLASGCDTYNVVSGQVTNDNLTFYGSH